MKQSAKFSFTLYLREKREENRQGKETLGHNAKFNQVRAKFIKRY